MCGISGILQYQTPIPDNVLERFNQSLSHRGPDAQSVYFSDHRHLGLGHCRLSIVDTSRAANQPFVSEDKSLILTFNGEIYNYPELRHELQSFGYVFRTTSDTEVLLRAYQHWGIDCLSRLNGMWAFAIWDQRKRQLFLARDRFGVKPVYYRYDGEHFAFASEQKAFRCHPQGLEVCAEQASFLMLYPEAVESERKTLYKDVDKLLPGEYLIVTQKGPEHKRWWNTYDQLTELQDLPSTAEDLQYLFSQACEIRTRTDVKIATALSGGLDSSAVTSRLATLPGIKEAKQLRSFIGSFVDSDMDEYHWAKLVVDTHQLDYRRVSVSEDDVLEHVEKSCLALEDVNDLPIVGQWKVYQAMHEDGYKVSLEGHGGDELLAGYHRHLTVYLGDVMRNRASPEIMATLIKALGDMRPGAGSAFVRSSLLQAPMSSEDLHHKLGSKKLYLRSLLRGTSHFSNDIVNERNSETYKQETMLFQKLYEDFHYFTLPYILRNYDRLSMSHSVEVRSPFLDYRFVLAAFKADSQLKLSGGRTKSLLRDHFPFIPEGIRKRTDKSGFSPPFYRWLKQGLGEWVVSFANDSIVRDSSLFDGKALQRAVNHCHESKEFEQMGMFWPLINLAILDKGTGLL
ncbi:asparagine synthase (glutamine-hydrolyzing) [Lacimicrobium alkaliphilum]|uniref:asparagine synthase (glutamine-hydrolyzing) n=1 Tax=Lacimicrobium alkaliphilum TaxID=1526571 RepID=A0A0U3B1A1_9ALTE|nr:asparagine synthase (glutamine-hydrolyzing) [Lacimicrobium alkaliphilum]ALS99064.1 hypothetical protein AT746_12850 [Lacimicrobium alkaliphilum]